MKLENQELIKEYYEKVKEEYPDLTFEELKKIVTGPFAYLKEQMAKPELPTVRLKYFGTFVVHEGRAREIQKRNKTMHKAGKLRKELYDERNEIIEKLLEKRKENN